MIRKLFAVAALLAFCSCDPSQEEQERLQRIDDSLMEIERVSIIERANQLLEATFESDTLKTATDSLTE